MFGGYLDREPTFQSQRTFSAQTISDDWFSSTLVPGGSTTTPAGTISFPRIDFGNGPSRATWDSNGDPREFVDPDDRYDFGPINYLQLPLERISAGALLNYDFTDTTELYAELMYANNKAISSLAPAGTFGAFAQINTDNPALTPANQQLLADNGVPLGPNVVGIGLSRRLLELGPRIIEADKDYTRLLAGLRGELGGSWEYDAWVSYTRGEEKTLQRNDASFSRVQQGLLVDPLTGNCIDPSNGCVPLNLFGEDNLSQAGVAFISVAPYVSTIEREQKLISAFVRGTLFSLPAGDVAAAIGAEWREDSGDLIADEALFSGDTLGYRAFLSVVGKESVSEVYAEVLVPVQSDPASTAFQCVGKFGVACDFFGFDNVFPENRMRTSAAWVAERWRASLAWYWIEGTQNSARDVAPVFGIPPDFINPAIETIGSKSYIDLDVNYELTDNLTLGFTVANLFDEGPAFMADNGSQANTDTEMYDVFGRAYTLRLSLNY